MDYVVKDNELFSRITKSGDPTLYTLFMYQVKSKAPLFADAFSRILPALAEKSGMEEVVSKHYYVEILCKKGDDNVYIKITSRGIENVIKDTDQVVEIMKNATEEFPEKEYLGYLESIDDDIREAREALNNDTVEEVVEDAIDEFEDDDLRCAIGKCRTLHNALDAMVAGDELWKVNNTYYVIRVSEKLEYLALWDFTTPMTHEDWMADCYNHQPEYLGTKTRDPESFMEKAELVSTMGDKILKGDY